MTTVRAALAQARERGVAALDAQLLLARILALPRTGVLAHDERALSDEQGRAWRQMLERRAGGEPLAYVLGEKEFHGLDLHVDSAVLVPRPETEALVDWASSLVAGAANARTSPATVVDLGTGSGAIALALKHRHPQTRVTATDISAQALVVARRNAARHGLEIELVLGSWWQPLVGRRFDLVVANPPYIAAGDAHLDALQHEPRIALTPGADGTAAIAEIAADAVSHLCPGGSMLVEHGFDQAEEVQQLLGRSGLVGIETRADLAGLARVTGGRRPAPRPARRVTGVTVRFERREIALGATSIEGS